jgi:acetyl esterase/lipase
MRQARGWNAGLEVRSRFWVLPLIAFLGALSALAGCSGQAILNGITPDSGYKIAHAVPFFGPYAGPALTLDVYTPAHADRAPVVVFLYGGSWQQGQTLPKEDYKFVGEALAEQGFVTVIPDYRLYPQVKFPGFLYDCAAAVAWAHARAAAYGGDPGKLVLLGHSAGAYNAAMLALDPEYLRQAGADRAWLRGMIGLAGPYDFLPLTDPVLQDLFAPAAKLSDTQPISFADGRNPPMLLIAGDNDDIVYAKNSINLYQRISDRGGRITKLIYPKMGHVKLVATLSSRLPGHARLMETIAGFVREVTSDAGNVADGPAAGTASSR